MNSIQSLWTEAKTYLELQKEYLKLDSAEKLSVLLSAVATVAVCLILALAALFFFVIAFALWLAKMVGAAWSFTIVGGAMLLIIIIILHFPCFNFVLFFSLINTARSIINSVC